MKRYGFIAVILLITVSAKAQKEISIDSLRQHIGDSVKICAKIYGGIFLDRSTDSNTLLNAGGSYPNAPLTILIKMNARQQFKNPPEVFFKDKEVCVIGKIILYKDKPEIVVYEEKQIQVK